MSAAIPCFLIEPTGRQQIFLRRYRSSAEKCPCPYGYHNAENYAGDGPEVKDSRGYLTAPPVEQYQDDPRWPVKCEGCNYEFSVMDDKDNWQVRIESIYRSLPTATLPGRNMTLRDAPPGAMWNGWWMTDYRHGPDGQYLILRMPGNHDWAIDDRASNCDSPCATCGKPYHACDAMHCELRPKLPDGTSGKPVCAGYEDSHPHQCWVRHGAPPMLTVDKNGVTCGAGAGSIIVPGWHGFLRNGVLVPC